MPCLPLYVYPTVGGIIGCACLAGVAYFVLKMRRKKKSGGGGGRGSGRIAVRSKDKTEKKEKKDKKGKKAKKGDKKGNDKLPAVRRTHIANIKRMPRRAHRGSILMNGRMRSV